MNVIDYFYLFSYLIIMLNSEIYSPISKIRDLLHLNRIDRVPVSEIEDLVDGYFFIRLEVVRISSIYLTSLVFNDPSQVFVHRATNLKITISMEHNFLYFHFYKSQDIFNENHNYKNAGLDFFNHLSSIVNEWEDKPPKELTKELISKAVVIYIQRLK
jgi:hypothetical protein